MNVLVVGATGRTGGHIVDNLLARRHRVTAFARRPEAVKIRNERLRVEAGDARDVDAVVRAVQGQDAVFMAFGPRTPGKPDIVTYASYHDDLEERAMRNLVAAMKMHGVKRLINLSSWGLTPALMNFMLRKIFVPHVLNRVLADKARAEAVLFASGIGYVNVRPGALMGSRRRGGVRSSGDGKGVKQMISRPDLADFMVAQLADDAWLGKSVYVGY